MIDSKQALDRYGDPEREVNMTLFDVPTHLELGAIPKRIYCNKDLVKPLTAALTNVVDRQLVRHIRTWDGCFNIRKKRNSRTASLHSWGLAIDINAAWNRQGSTPTMSLLLVKAFTDAGFEWGGTWRGKSIDGMHFQLKEFPK